VGLGGTALAAGNTVGQVVPPREKGARREPILTRRGPEERELINGSWDRRGEP
jgi:hypothetical protein